MYIERFTQENELPSYELSCVVKKVSGYNKVHSHEYYELELVLDGGGTYTVDSRTYEIRPGALLFMSPASFHDAVFAPDTTIVNIMFDAHMCDSRLLYTLFRDRSHVWEYAEGSGFSFLETVCRELAQLLENDSKSDIYAGALLDSIVGKVMQLTGAECTSNSADAIQKAVIYLHSNFTEQITLEAAAAVSGYSPSYFSERFRSYVGTNFREYLINLRFSHAKKLLKYTDMSVTEICFESGFNNYAHFMKSFKTRYKTTPIAYRKQHGEVR